MHQSSSSPIDVLGWLTFIRRDKCHVQIAYQCSILNVKLLGDSFFLLTKLVSSRDSSFPSCAGSSLPESLLLSSFRLRPRGILAYKSLQTFTPVSPVLQFWLFWWQKGAKLQMGKHNNHSYWLIFTLHGFSQSMLELYYFHEAAAHSFRCQQYGGCDWKESSVRRFSRRTKVYRGCSSNLR